MNLTKEINPNIFREYDLRSVNAEEELTDDVVYTIGRSFGSYVRNMGYNKVIVGHDNRKSSPRISSALIEGLTQSGVDVLDLGLVTTPMLYYGRIYYDLPAGIMITASHCEKQYNGFKISFSKLGNAYGKYIEEFKEYTYNLGFSEGQGSVQTADIKAAYLENLKNIKLGDKKIKVGIDCGNGTGSTIIRDVLDMFDIEYELLYCDSDPEFPNHIPDPAVPENMIDLGNKVRELGLDFGIGIDGDADRVGAVDENGNYLSADLIMLIVYRSIASTMKNKKGLFDVKCSRTLIDGLKDLNIDPHMNRTGNSYCNLAMQGNLDDPDDDFDFGGEYSGHLFFRDRYQGFDDGIYAGLRLMEIFSNFDKTFSHLLDNTNKYYATPELKVEVTDNNKTEIVNAIKDYVIEKEYSYEDIDGIRVEFDDGWALIRQSNTSPNLTLRFEATTEERLNQLKEEFEKEINEQIKMHP